MKDIIVTPAQMKLLENASQKSGGISLYTLMSNAGNILAQSVEQIARSKKLCDIIFICGKGNNGGDGFVAASELSEISDFNVSVIFCSGKPATDLSKKAFSTLGEKVSIITTDFTKAIHESQVIVDCVFGTGFKGEIATGVLSNLFDTINRSANVRVACDIPSGANSLNGIVSEHTIKCDYTVTFGAVKTGMLFQPCKNLCGIISVGDIGIPDEAYDSITYLVKRIDYNYAVSHIPEREPDSNKGSYGKLINVAGSANYIGAALLSTLSALRSGVGLCSVATQQNVINCIASKAMEAIYLPMTDDPDINTSMILSEPKATAILVGCGLSQSYEAKHLVENLIEKSTIPLIIDADGINALPDRINILRKAKASIVLTPHPGEFSRLTGKSISEIIKDKFSLAKEFAENYNVTLVLKGAGTVIAAPDRQIFVSSVGNAGLARGGSGDVLAGIIGSLVAQGLPVTEACCTGVFIHGLCADRVASKYSMQGMLPEDLINELPLLFHDMNR